MKVKISGMKVNICACTGSAGRGIELGLHELGDAHQDRPDADGQDQQEVRQHRRRIVRA